MAENKDKKDKAEEPEGAAEQEDELIPSKKVIYIEIDDEVSSVFNKIKKVSVDEVYIVVPKRSVIFQSGVNLKILKRKANDSGKQIYFVTNDKNGTYLAQQAGIEVFDKVNGKGTPSLFSTDNVDEKLLITPLRATVNSVDEDNPTRMSERKLSISEILRRSKKSKSVDVTKISPTPQKPKKKKSKFVLVAPNRQALIGLIVASVTVLLIIIYIALPGATIYLTPAASVLEKSVNITLADYQKNRAELETHPHHVIASYPVEATVTRTITHSSTGKRFSDRGANASGNITIINNTNTSWPLVAKTRFQTDDGIVFRIADSVTVPAATTSGPGKVEAYVVADITDATGEVVGERGNIEPSTFFLPGLRDDSRSKLYAESYEPMTGGVTDFLEFVSAEDIDAARQRMKDELIKAAKEELKGAVAVKEELTSEEEGAYILLEGDTAIKMSEPVVNVDEGLVGQDLDQFTVTGEMYVSGVYYEHDAMLEILKDELLLKKSPQKELLRVNEESTSYRIFEWDEQAGRIKLTANIKGIEQYTIDEEKENGARLIQKIKDHIVGKDIEEAKLYIQNLPEINKVEIDSWPAWSPTIPNIPDNIDFEVRPTVNLQ